MSKPKTFDPHKPPEDIFSIPVKAKSLRGEEIKTISHEPVTSIPTEDKVLPTTTKESLPIPPPKPSRSRPVSGVPISTSNELKAHEIIQQSSNPFEEAEESHASIQKPMTETSRVADRIASIPSDDEYIMVSSNPFQSDNIEDIQDHNQLEKQPAFDNSANEKGISHGGDFEIPYEPPKSPVDTQLHDYETVTPSYYDDFIPESSDNCTSTTEDFETVHVTDEVTVKMEETYESIEVTDSPADYKPYPASNPFSDDSAPETEMDENTLPPAPPIPPDDMDVDKGFSLSTGFAPVPIDFASPVPVSNGFDSFEPLNSSVFGKDITTKPFGQFDSFAASNFNDNANNAFQAPITSRGFDFPSTVNPQPSINSYGFDIPASINFDSTPAPRFTGFDVPPAINFDAASAISSPAKWNFPEESNDDAQIPVDNIDDDFSPPDVPPPPFEDTEEIEVEPFPMEIVASKPVIFSPEDVGIYIPTKPKTMEPSINVLQIPIAPHVPSKYDVFDDPDAALAELAPVAFETPSNIFIAPTKPKETEVKPKSTDIVFDAFDLSRVPHPKNSQPSKDDKSKEILLHQEPIAFEKFDGIQPESNDTTKTDGFVFESTSMPLQGHEQPIDDDPFDFSGFTKVPKTQSMEGFQPPAVDFNSFHNETVAYDKKADFDAFGDSPLMPAAASTFSNAFDFRKTVTSFDMPTSKPSGFDLFDSQPPVQVSFEKSTVVKDSNADAHNKNAFSPSKASDITSHSVSSTASKPQPTEPLAPASNTSHVQLSAGFDEFFVHPTANSQMQSKIQSTQPKATFDNLEDPFTVQDIPALKHTAQTIDFEVFPAFPEPKNGVGNATKPSHFSSDFDVFATSTQSKGHDEVAKERMTTHFDEFDDFSLSVTAKSPSQSSLFPAAPVSVPPPTQFGIDSDFESDDDPFVPSAPITKPKTNTEVTQKVTVPLSQPTTHSGPITSSSIGITSRPSHVPGPAAIAKPDPRVLQPFAANKSKPPNIVSSAYQSRTSTNPTTTNTTTQQKKPVAKDDDEDEVDLLDLNPESTTFNTHPSATSINVEEETDIMKKFRRMYNLSEETHAAIDDFHDDDFSVESHQDRDLSSSIRTNSQTTNTGGPSTLALRSTPSVRNAESLPSEGTIYGRIFTK